MVTTVRDLTDIPSVNAYLTRIGAKPRSLRTAYIGVASNGYEMDVVVVKFDKTGFKSISGPRASEYSPTETEVKDMADECSSAVWPTHIPAVSLNKLPKHLMEARSTDPNSLFYFNNEKGETLLIQHRVEIEGVKHYKPWTFWSDQEWRSIEPDGDLPIYNLDKLGGVRGSVVWLHEGARAARYCQWMKDGSSFAAKDALKAHPWGKEIEAAVHIGWIGGAHAKSRTNWKKLESLGIEKLYIMADNDKAGMSAALAISKETSIPAHRVLFNETEFPAGFDMADPWPEALFKDIGGVKFYRGPRFGDCAVYGTRVLDEYTTFDSKGNPKPAYRLNPKFANEWVWVMENEIFVHTTMTRYRYGKDQFKAALLCLARMGVDFPSMLQAASDIHVDSLAYRPGLPNGLIREGKKRTINIHEPGLFPPEQGDMTIWDEFLEQLIPDPKDRHEVKRWIATVIFRPETRIGYALLLASSKQGVGKTTLGQVLAHCVGHHNTSYPEEKDIVDSSFNSWKAMKRLAVIEELYAGHSWKTYNALKAAITEKEFTVNEKFEKPYKLMSYLNIVACSNDSVPLKIAADDRRWLIPKVTELLWPREKFQELNDWISGPGIPALMYWAGDQDEDFYIGEARHAPDTERKKEMQSSSKSVQVMGLEDYLDVIKSKDETGEPAVARWSDIEEAIKTSTNWNGNNTMIMGSDKIAAIKASGLHYRDQYKLNQKRTFIIFNDSARAIVEEGGDVMKICVRPRTFFEGVM